MTQELYKKLAADFPEEALSVDSSRGFDLTSVKAQYIVERLNEVLGVAGWQFVGEYERTDDGGTLYHGRLNLPALSRHTDTGELVGEVHYVEGVGYSAKKKNIGDCRKGARTDALSKAASMIGVANEVFKGNVKPPSKGGSRSVPTGKPANKPLTRPGKNKSIF